MISDMDTKTWMVIPDLQVPLHDERFVEKLIDVAEYIQPDGLLFIGDLTDSTEVGRWVKGGSGEFTGNLQAAFDETASIVARFRRAIGQDAEMVLIDSNHDERTQKYVAEYAPALSTLRSLDLPSLIGLGRSRVSYVRGPYEFASGVLALHGHERAYTSVSGRWGNLRVTEYGKHIVYGHTHTPNLLVTAQGVDDYRRNLWHMNVGNGMDMSQAGYLRDGYATWAQAFGLVHHDGVNAYPELVMAQRGSFALDGRVW